MPLARRITDWERAYGNVPAVPDGPLYPDRWAAAAAAFRETVPAERVERDVPHGRHERERFDLFRPEGTPAGLLVFVHGGYWVRFTKDHFSHLAAGALARGWAVALPGYPLCPQARIGGIVEGVGRAIALAAERVGGPIVLSGHSAGGQIVTRLACTDTPLPEAVTARLARVVSISGVHDLRPLLNLALNAQWRMDLAEARALSPALAEPLPSLDCVCWVGATERTEFVRQNRLLADIWTGLCASVRCIEEPDRHHFDVVEGLCEAGSALTETLLAP